MPAEIAVKVDVDTDRGTREGVLPLARICQRYDVPATFLFSLGPDNTGRAIRRIFRPGFLGKVARTNVAGNYGIRTLLNGTLLPAPAIGRRNADVMREVRDMGFEVGIHCYDHFTWQYHLHRMAVEKIRDQFSRAIDEFVRVFGTRPKTAGAPGWQCNEHSLAVYDEADLLYASDARGAGPFYPSVGGATFTTLQIPTTLPTLDELIGRDAYPEGSIVGHYLRLLGASDGLHVHTVHAEIEGLNYASMFEQLLEGAREAGIGSASLEDVAERLCDSEAGSTVPVCALTQGALDGRSGDLALQGAETLKKSSG